MCGGLGDLGYYPSGDYVFWGLVECCVHSMLCSSFLSTWDHMQLAFLWIFFCRSDELRALFERFGEVRDVYLPRDYYTE